MLHMAKRPLLISQVGGTLAPAVQQDNGNFRRLPEYPQHIPAMNGKAIHDTPAIQSLDRGLAILEAVAASSQPVPLKQLTDLIGIDRSSVFRLANTLRQRRFLTHPKGSKDYILGPTA